MTKILKGSVGGATVYVGDCRRVLRRLPPSSLHLCVTSPPYYGLRRYSGPDTTWPDGWSGQLGNEPTPSQYIAHLVECFRSVWRVLRDDAVLFVNIGDSYTANRSYQVPSTKGGPKHSPAQAGQSSNQVPPGCKPKDLLGIPWHLAFALRDDGWYLRQDIIWHKPSPMPESVRDRCTKAHEYLFMLTKSERYYFDTHAIAEPASESGIARNKYKRDHPRGWHTEAVPISGGDAHDGIVRGTQTRNKRSVWTIANNGYRGAHFACFPPKLVEPCILAGTSEHGCCPSCGAPWRRLLSKGRVPTRPALVSKIEGQAAEAVGNRDPLRHVTRTETIGWESACKCDAGEPIPCGVVDPFGGSGVTGVVANRLGRRSIVIDVSKEYGLLAMERLRKGK